MYIHRERFGPEDPRVSAQAGTMRYFFQLEDGVCIRDPKGEEFPDDAAALVEAVNVAQELSKLDLHAHQWRLVVKNADGIRVGSVPLVPPADVRVQGVSMPSRSIH
jgi:uncharacterized protein DUF6894